MSSHLKTTFTIVFIIVAISILTYAGVLLYKQYTSGPETTSTSTNISSSPIESLPDTANINSQNTPDPSIPSQQPQTSSNVPPTIQKPPKSDSSTDTSSKTALFIPQTIPSTDKNARVYIPLSKVSCEKNCSQFTKDTELQYCQEYCGLESWNITDNCSDLKNLEQDYCFKAQAIDKTDPTLCKKITDDNIRNACQNRVLEDIVDQTQQ